VQYIPNPNPVSRIPPASFPKLKSPLVRVVGWGGFFCSFWVVFFFFWCVWVGVCFFVVSLFSPPSTVCAHPVVPALAPSVLSPFSAPPPFSVFFAPGRSLFSLFSSPLGCLFPVPGRYRFVRLSRSRGLLCSAFFFCLPADTAFPSSLLLRVARPFPSFVSLSYPDLFLGFFFFPLGRGRECLLFIQRPRPLLYSSPFKERSCPRRPGVSRPPLREWSNSFD